jgi:hypothetical protein
MENKWLANEIIEIHQEQRKFKKNKSYEKNHKKICNRYDRLIYAKFLFFFSIFCVLHLGANIIPSRIGYFCLKKSEEVRCEDGAGSYWTCSNCGQSNKCYEMTCSECGNWR